MPKAVRLIDKRCIFCRLWDLRENFAKEKGLSFCIGSMSGIEPAAADRAVLSCGQMCFTG